MVSGQAASVAYRALLLLCRPPTLAGALFPSRNKFQTCRKGRDGSVGQNKGARGKGEGGCTCRVVAGSMRESAMEVP